MPPEAPARAGAHPPDRLHVWSLRVRALGAALPYVLIAAALLAASEVIWLWHSWPVREVLDGEQLTAGASL